MIGLKHAQLRALNGCVVQEISDFIIAVQFIVRKHRTKNGYFI